MSLESGQDASDQHGFGGAALVVPSGVAKGGSATTATSPTCGQTCQDYLLGWALNDTFWLLWNQWVKGTTVGAKDVSGSCPFGGSFHLVGTTSLDANGTDHVDVTIELATCSNVAARYSLEFSGSLRVVGNFEGADDTAALTFTATGFSAAGTIKYLDSPRVQTDCALTEVQQGMGETGTLNGRICDREFSSTTALSSASRTTGAGGSG